VMREHDLSEFLRRYFNAHRGTPLAVPIELAQQLVWGAVEFARGLGFERHPDFERASGNLGKLNEPLAIRVGRAGQPLFIEGPYDDSARVIQKLEESVGSGNFQFTVRQPTAIGSR
jgi:hypothetical protein